MRSTLEQPRYGLGERDVVLSFAGVIMTPGAIIYADRDGWLVSDQPL
ncbi:MAG: hypothetical protein WCN85_04580 [Burkholderiales bacterium]